jgi:ankyrin repeat protein
MVDDEGATALWYAVRSEKTDAISLLLEQPSINVNHCMTFGEGWDEHQETPLIYAIHHGFGEYDVISLLIKHPDTDLTFPDEDGTLPIHFAIRAERTEIVQNMLERGGFDINADSPTGSGWTALHTAAHWAAVEIIELLVAQEGIDVNRSTSSGETPLIRARYEGSIEALLAHPDVQVDRVDNDGRSALSHTAERGNLESARVLLEHGARPDLQDTEGHTPIGRADKAGLKGMVMLLQAAIGQE